MVFNLSPFRFELCDGRGIRSIRLIAIYPALYIPSHRGCFTECAFNDVGGGKTLCETRGACRGCSALQLCLRPPAA